METCTACGARWDEGRFTEGCQQCGGGALEHACPMCLGACGQRWKRAVLDSHDFNRAHWHGRCGLGEAERLALLERLFGKP